MTSKKYDISVLYVEDDRYVKEELTELLRRRVNTVYVADNGIAGLELYQEHHPDLVITDLNMPVMDGLKMAREIKAIYRNAQIIVTTAYNESNFFIESIDIGINQYVLKPIVVEKFIAAIESCMELIKWERQMKQQELTLRNTNEDLERRVEERTRELQAANYMLQLEITDRQMAERALQENNLRLNNVMKGTINALATTLQITDSYTAEHQQNVATLSVEIARILGFSSDEQEGIWVAGTLHDIGKIYVPSQILNKRTKLTDIEFALIKTHSQVGHDIVKDIPFAWPVAQILLQHHERMNGSGYPNGIAGDEILPASRIIAVADVVDAITAHRPYRPALGIEVALGEITKNRGISYDEKVVDACLKVIESGFAFRPGS